ncbi:hypothetical protein SMG44B_30111 [Stenotrophomonas maltophilia]
MDSRKLRLPASGRHYQMKPFLRRSTLPVLV